MEWQPIETAPKEDGATILGYTKEAGRVLVLRWHASTSRWRTDVYVFVPFTPTHWMPLPEPPSRA